MAVRFYFGTVSIVIGQHWPASDPIVKDLHTSVPPPSEQSPRSRGRGGGMNVPDTLRAAAYALSDRTGLERATALAGLLQNRADDMERNIAIWRRTRQDVPALIAKYYGVYLTVARAVLSDPLRPDLYRTVSRMN